MKNKISIFFAALMGAACTSEQNELSQTVLDNHVEVFLQDIEGNTLFETPGFETSNTRTFYMLNGEAVENNHLNYDSPKMFVMRDDPRHMLLFINDSPSEAFPETILKWNATESDTLKAQFSYGSPQSEAYSRCKKLWLNGDLVWDGTVEGQIQPREVIIVK